MSPQPPRDDEQDFLEDFVLEDGTELPEDSAEDGLEELFAVPPGTELTLLEAAAEQIVEPEPQPEQAPEPAPEAASIEPTQQQPRPLAFAAPAEDPEDLLFQDHTRMVQPTEQFAEPVGFVEQVDIVEQADKVWQGEQLELGAVATPPSANDQEITDFALEAEAEAEWEIDAEQDLELVGADDEVGNASEQTHAAGQEPHDDVFPAEVFTSEELLQQVASTDGSEELEELSPEAAAAMFASASFVEPEELDEQSLVLVEDASDSWSEAADTLDVDAADAPPDAELTEDLALEEVAAAAEIEPGWEPLPSANMDALAEVEEVGVPAVDETGLAETGYEDAAAASLDDSELAPVLAGPTTWQAPAAAAGGVDEELYQEHEAAELAVVGGAQAHRRPRRAAAWVAAACLCVAGAAAAYGFLPEWTGTVPEPEPTVIAQVPRPSLQVAVTPPPLPEPKTEVALRVAQAEPIPEPPEPVPAQPTVVAADEPTTPAVLPGEGTATKPVESPVATQVATVAEPVPPTGASTPAKVVEPEPPQATPPVAAGDPGSQPADGPVVPTETMPGWSTAKAGSEIRHGTAPLRRVRIGANDALVTDDPLQPAGTQAIDGMLPGSRAFAQLLNGNYFIGNVKQIDASQVTLRLGDGEITLVRGDLAKLMPLGTADYEALQKVNSGSVRLTNRNRLVGSILSDIADDYVVLEFRSNRVMLPKAAVGEVVQGDHDAPLRLATTNEEDDWLRRLVERQLGTGLPAAPPGGSAR